MDGLEIEYENGVMRASVGGDVDHHMCASVREDIDRAFFKYAPKKLILDLTGMKFMDSSGLGLIMGRHTLMSSLGGTLTVRRPNERVVRIFKLAGLERIVTIEEGKHEA